MRGRRVVSSICLAFLLPASFSAQQAPGLSMHGRKIQEELAGNAIGATITVIESHASPVCGKLTVKDASSFDLETQPGTRLSYWYDEVSKVSTGCAANRPSSPGRDVAKVIGVLAGVAAVAVVIVLVATPHD